MKEWRVYSKQEPERDHRGVIIWWPAWDEREAREWFRENVEGTKPGHFYYGATLELVEFETREERIEKALATSQEVLISMHSSPAWMREQVDAGKCLECAAAIERVEPHLGRYYRALHTNHELLSH